MTTPISPQQAAANLTAALAALADLGQKTPCQLNPAPWCSDDKAERAQAVEACQHCPIQTPCATYAVAAGERWLVWGGIDRHGWRARRKAKAT